MDELIWGRHIRLYKEGYFIPVRRPASMDYLQRLDERIKPEVIFYTAGRFQFPERLGPKNKKGSYFLYQDQLIVDIDEWTPEDILRISNSNYCYLAFTGSGFHICLPRPRFVDEEVLSPKLREEITAKNNAFLLEKIANEHDVKVDILPEPRHLFKIPFNFKYGNRMVRVFEDIPEKAELEELSKRKTRWRSKERKERTTVRVLAFSNNVKGTRGYVLIAYVSKSLAERMVEKYNLKASVYVENGIKDYLLDIQVVPKERIIKILRKESNQSLKTFLKYRHLLGIFKGSVTVFNLEADRSQISRGHASLLKWKNIDIEGGAGERKVDLCLVEIKKI